MMTQSFLIPEKLWQDLIKRKTTPSECHCKCGTIFLSLSYYVGKKTKDVIQDACPSCGSWEMDIILPQKEHYLMPYLEFPKEEKRKKFRSTRKKEGMTDYSLNS